MEDMAITITIMAMVGVFLQNLWKLKPQHMDRKSLPMDRKSDRNIEDHIRRKSDHRSIMEKAVKSFLNMMMIIMFLLKMTTVFTYLHIRLLMNRIMVEFHRKSDRNIGGDGVHILLQKLE